MTTRVDAITAVEEIIDALRTRLQSLRDTAPLTDPETIREILPVVAGSLRALQDLEEWLFAWRLHAWQAGRALRPPITNPELGQLANVSEVAVMKVLRKSRDQEEARANGR